LPGIVAGGGVDVLIELVCHEVFIAEEERITGRISHNNPKFGHHAG
jgi:hypothetical protein